MNIEFYNLSCIYSFFSFFSLGERGEGATLYNVVSSIIPSVFEGTSLRVKKEMNQDVKDVSDKVELFQNGNDTFICQENF